MVARSVVFLLLIGALMIAVIGSHPAAPPPRTRVPTATATVEATLETTMEITSEATIEATAAAMIEATSEATVELTIEVTVEAASDVAVTPESTEATTLVGDPARGQQIFHEGLYGAPPCSSCHATQGRASLFAIAPNLSGVSSRAAKRAPGMTAPQYIEDSIRHPQDFVVPGFHVSMPSIFGEKYSDQDIADLVAYLMTL